MTKPMGERSSEPPDDAPQGDWAELWKLDAAEAVHVIPTHQDLAIQTAPDIPAVPPSTATPRGTRRVAKRILTILVVGLLAVAVVTTIQFLT